MAEISQAEKADIFELIAKIPNPKATEKYPKPIGIPSEKPFLKSFFIILTFLFFC